MKRLQEGVCPADYYTKKELAHLEGISPEKMAKLARDTLDVVAKLALAGGTPLEKFAVRYNSCKNGLITDPEINFFFWHTRLQPFAHLIQLFVRRRKAPGGGVHDYADFGIRRSYYDEYKASGRLPQVLHRGRMPKHGPEATRETRQKVAFAGGGRVDVPINPVFQAFRAGIEACNAVSTKKVTVPEMVLAAIREYMEKRPTLFDVQGACNIDIEPVARMNTSLYATGLDPGIVDAMYGFIQRHNAGGGQPITMSDFVGAAIEAHLERT